LILDEPTADLDPNEKAEVIRYIQEIGKDRTVLLSTHNLQEAEQACSRAIIVSKGRVVADGPLDEIRARTGAVRYVITVDGKAGAQSKISFSQLEAACKSLRGVTKVRSLVSDDKAQHVELAGPQNSDLRAEIFNLVVEKGWVLLELRRDAQSLDSVFRDLTRGDEALDRGRAFEPPTADAGSNEDDAEDTDDSASDEADAPAPDSSQDKKEED
jgi:ABC-2 type transport system ATP-binding protein